MAKKKEKEAEGHVERHQGEKAVPSENHDARHAAAWGEKAPEPEQAPEADPADSADPADPEAVEAAEKASEEAAEDGEKLG